MIHFFKNTVGYTYKIASFPQVKHRAFLKNFYFVYTSHETIELSRRPSWVRKEKNERCCRPSQGDFPCIVGILYNVFFITH